MAADPSATNPSSGKSAGRRGWGLPIVVLTAVGLTIVFWLPLWTGGGLVGSDIYAYFLPQKAFYAEQLREGTLPLWNNRIGWGYPQVAESQTGVFYPLHLPLYLWLDLNAAYNASMLVHYVLAFFFMWMYARQLGLVPAAAGLAALVYVYGWFPARIGLEWAIVGGAWLPLALFFVERYLETRFWRFAFGLTVVLAVQMLAGHFTLAFVTQLAVAAYLPMRLWFAHADWTANRRATRGAACGALALAVAAAFPLAAVQLVPTWELKQQSQRQTVSEEHDPRYGYIPPLYLTQIIAPWLWYADEQAFKNEVPAGGSRTNRVEAHLYFGLAPLGLAVWGLWQRGRGLDRRLVLWWLLGSAALVYSTGVLTPVTKHLPGFGFFEGPGRFGVITTLAAGLLAGCGLESILRESRPSVRLPIVLLVFAATAGDLWLVSRQLVFDPWLIKEFPALAGSQSKFVYLADEPPILRLAESRLRAELSTADGPVRLFSDGKNLPSLLGVATLPTYLGLGPAAYYDRERMFPGALNFGAPPAVEQVDWLRRAGVTHLLSFIPLDPQTWPVREVWRGGDSFLNPALARSVGEPLFLYELSRTRGRIAWSDESVEAPARLIEYRPGRVVVETAAKSSARLILTDLSYPGWQATVDGKPTEPLTVEGVFRGFDLSAGKHTVIWNYRPTSVYWGAIISLSTLLVALALGHVRFWHPQWLLRSPKSTAT